MVHVEDVQQEVMGLGVDPVEIEPEELMGIDELSDGLGGGLGSGSVGGDDSVHDASLTPSRCRGADGTRAGGGAGQMDRAFSRSAPVTP